MGWARLAGGRTPNKAAGLPLPGATTAGGASLPLAPPRPGDALAPGTLAREESRGRPPSRPRTAPLRDNGPPPPPRGGEIQRQRSAARHGARRPESAGGGGRGERRGWRRTREPAAAPPAGRGAARSPTAAAEAGTQTSSLSTPGRQGLHTKRSGTPNLRQGRGPPDAPCPPTVSRACPARAPCGPGPRGAPLSPTHPQLRAPAHGGT